MKLLSLFRRRPPKAKWTRSPLPDFPPANVPSPKEEHLRRALTQCRERAEEAYRAREIANRARDLANARALTPRHRGHYFRGQKIRPSQHGTGLRPRSKRALSTPSTITAQKAPAILRTSSWQSI